MRKQNSSLHSFLIVMMVVTIGLTACGGGRPIRPDPIPPGGSGPSIPSLGDQIPSAVPSGLDAPTRPDLDKLLITPDTFPSGLATPNWPDLKPLVDAVEREQKDLKAITYRQIYSKDIVTVGDLSAEVNRIYTSTGKRDIWTMVPVIVTEVLEEECVHLYGDTYDCE